ncbi:histone family protein nucleoid-structuring protein H-NS [Acidovorax sp. NO-1]|uniref:H-NS histone family protein n=1 Tax=Acidovorax sp. NO-1 TaxID=512030 RepID=UPI00023FCCD1|nr:H-NS histone family protein [Acidovorax sp. NO-1]EHL24800.1 histone family protein nucleoid-structuring protein H-NS [Acidovorax sp. NO-1]
MSELKLPQALAKKAELDASLEAIRLSELDTVIKEVQQTIQLYKLTPTELFPDMKVVPRNTVRRNAGERPVKYRNELGETWGGGVGPRPKWIKDAIARGEDIEKYSVAK